MLQLVAFLLLPASAAALSMPLRPCFDEPVQYMLAVSRGAKVSRNGIVFYDTPVIHEHGYACPTILNGLCSHGNYSFFRCTDAPTTFETAPSVPFEKLWLNEAACAKLPSQRFDVTACDVSNKDETILWGDGMVSVLYDTEIPYGPKVIIALLMVWLVINLGETMALLLEVEGSKPGNHTTAALCLALVLMVGWYTPWSTWSTLDERYTYVCVIGYILCYSAYHIQNQNTVNVIVGCLLLVTSRYYQTCETQYVAPFVLIIAARLFQKCLIRRPGSTARYAFMCLDVIMLFLQYAVGMHHSSADATQGPLWLLSLLFCAWCFARFVTRLA